MTDPVQQQIAAYNSPDLDGFVDAYAEDVVIEDGEGYVVARGHDGIRDLYGELFSQSPRLCGNWTEKKLVFAVQSGRMFQRRDASRSTRGSEVFAWRIRRVAGSG